MRNQFMTYKQFLGKNGINYKNLSKNEIIEKCNELKKRNKFRKYLIKHDIQYAEDDNNVKLEQLVLETKKIINTEGRQKRFQTLVDVGRYKIKDLSKVGTIQICENCKNEFIFKYCASHRNGFCSKPCSLLNPKTKYKRKISFLKNKNIDISQKSEMEIDEIFHKEYSDFVKISQPQRNATIYAKGSDEYIRMGILANKRRKRNFLIKNNIRSKDEIEVLDDDAISKLFLENFNTITKHGEKIENACRAIYSDEEIKTYKQQGKKTQILNIANEQLNCKYDLFEDIPLDIKQICEKIRADATFRKNGIIGWKKNHLINLGYNECELASEKNINDLYSGYISKRMNLRDDASAGWKHTKKGFYVFKNINKKIFFRSSWEEVVFKIIDDLCFLGLVQDVYSPMRIEYVLDDVIRHYYPDIELILYDNTVLTIEIKPKNRIYDIVNIAKFKAAIKYFKNFIILTEDEIFHEKIYETILKGKGNYEKYVTV